MVTAAQFSRSTDGCPTAGRSVFAAEAALILTCFAILFDGVD